MRNEGAHRDIPLARPKNPSLAGAPHFGWSPGRLHLGTEACSVIPGVQDPVALLGSCAGQCMFDVALPSSQWLTVVAPSENQ